jgi:O-antigen ligase
MFMIDRLSRNFIVFAFHILLLVTPLVWSSTTFELFEYPKMMLTYFVTLLIVVAWSVRMIIAKRVLINKSFWDVPVILFFASQVISTLISLDVHTSIWGYYSRFHGGLASTIAYITLFYAAISNLKKSEVKSLLITTLVALSATSLYSFGEHFGYSPSCYLIRGELGVSCWIQDVQSRVYGTFGQPNWQAAYIVTTIFLPLAFFKTKLLPTKNASKQKALSKNAPRTWQALLQNNQELLALLIFVLGLCVLLFTKSRSGIAGFALGFGVYWLVNALAAMKLRKALPHLTRQTVTSFVIVSLISAAIGLSFGKGIWQPLDNVLFNRFNQSTSPSPSDLSSAPTTVAAPLGGTESGEIRKIVWQGAIDLWRLYPWFGSGVETFAYAYYQVRPVAHNMVSEWDFLYNKAHNEFLNFLATSGIVGLLTYVLLLVGIFWGAVLLIWNRIKASSEKNTALAESIEHLTDIRIAIALVSGISALSVSNFIGFSTVNVATLLFIFPALIALLMQKDEMEKSSETHEKLTLSQSAALIALSLAFILAASKLATMHRADTLFARGSALVDTNEMSSALQDLSQASIAVPNEPKYAEELSLATAQVAASLQTMNQATVAAQLAIQAESISNQTLELNPYHLNHYKTRARVFVLLAEIEPAFIEKAVETLEAATTLAPTDAKVWYNLGLLYDQTNELEKAQSAYEHTIVLKPNYEQALISLAQLFEKIDNKAKAVELYTHLLTSINSQNPEAIAGLSKLQEE